MKLILVILVFGFLQIGCAGNSLNMNRTPSSIPNAMSKITADEKNNATKNLDSFLKYYLIKNSTFEKIDPLDCKAYVQQNQVFCKTDECKAILTEQDFRCVDQSCKAILLSREELCTDEACKAVVTNQPEKCKSEDSLCQSIINTQSSTCAAGSDCRAYLDKNSIDCKSPQCKAFVNENMNFCGESAP